jgi:hypothetical protein
MRFEARELPPYVEHVEANALQQGDVYFIALFLDDEMLVPELKPVVFVGRNLERGFAVSVPKRPKLHARLTKRDPLTETSA